MTDHQPSWQRLLWWLIAAVVGLDVLACVLPRLLPALVVLGVLAGLLRILWFYTDRY